MYVKKGKKEKEIKRKEKKMKRQLPVEYDSVPTFHSKILFICQLIKIFKNICNLFRFFLHFMQLKR
jgi:hypothetical protein